MWQFVKVLGWKGDCSGSALSSAAPPNSSIECSDALIEQSDNGADRAPKPIDSAVDSNHEARNPLESESYLFKRRGSIRAIDSCQVVLSDSTQLGDLPPYLREYPFIESLIAVLKTHSKRYLWQVCRNIINYTQSQMEAEVRQRLSNVGSKADLQTRFFYCNKNGCNWKIQFRRDIQKKVYFIDESLTNRTHNHPFKTDLPQSSGKYLD